MGAYFGSLLRARLEPVQALLDHLHLMAVSRNLDADVVRQFANPADRGRDHGFPEAKSAHHRAGTLSERGLAKIQDDTAGGHEPIEVIQSLVPFDDHAIRQSKVADPVFDRYLRVPLSENQEASVGQTVQQLLEHRQTFPDLLVGPLIAENADQRRAGLKPKHPAVTCGIHGAETHPVGHHPDRTTEPLQPDQPFGVVTMHDARLAAIEKAPQHQELMWLRRSEG